ncbi:helix-hairpin-helix domain-containing protein [Lutimonas zeaxanthinifaciens]|uniref:helix-hairpin-helix domain-containing protein n=1 Tax=Lutimonas zeaxanthinifaciens TaxID=3060215 RepID=UPI00265C8D27|nr:helix-hairpin-helix domain-containing protein [Lutimonas sp. YSD2104]WKK64927.1 helix-hairpin-helix domain-containing protein [Lutimonas sp. YSD2104]
MNFFESHFWYTKRQRNGILFLLLTLIIVLVSIDILNNREEFVYNEYEFDLIQQKIDSLKRLETLKTAYKEHKFNPNYLTDYKAYRLGLTSEEIDRLFLFRKNGNFVNSKEEFQQVTRVSDSILNHIAPLFSFPKWVSKQKTAVSQKRKSSSKTIGLNLVSVEDLMDIKGMEFKIAKRILAYRKRLGGYSLSNQLYEVYDLRNDLVPVILKRHPLLHPPNIPKTNVNQATFKEILSNPYLDYGLTKKIMQLKDEQLRINDLEDLKKIDSFPLENFDRIALYLCAE